MGPSRTALAVALLLFMAPVFPDCLAWQGDPAKGHDSGLPQSVTVRGVVILENGSPPPFGVTIEQDCGDGFVKQAETTASGYFYFPFQVRRSSRGWCSFADSGECADPAESSFSRIGSAPSPAQAPMDYQSFSVSPVGCELRARYPGFRSGTIRVPDDKRSHDVGLITLHPNARSRGKFVSVTSLHAPKKARKKMEAAVSSFHRKNLSDAEDSLKSALQYYPEYAEAWFWLGWLYEQQQLVRESRASYEKAVRADRSYVQPYVGLAELAGMEQEWQKMADFSEQALALDPLSFPEAYTLNAVANFRLKRLDAAEKSARKAQQMDSNHRNPKIHLLLADILYLKSDPAGSAGELREYLTFAPGAADAEAVRALLLQRENTK